MGESGGSAGRKAAELKALGKRSAGAWAAGADGERRVGEALSALPPEWLVLHDRLLMPGLAESNLDHLLVGPAGIVLIDAKNWAGQIGEWEGSVFQHSTLPGGGRRHRPVDREFAGVRGMGTEIARRVGVGVTVVICLAGRQAEQFGEPRVVRDVWVVPIGHLVEWLRSRPRVELPDRQQLDVLVRTEFPSTTTDAELLLAMGRHLNVPRSALSRRAARRLQGSPSAASTRRASSTRPAGRSRVSRPGWRRSAGLLRPLFALGVAVGMLLAVQNGALTLAADTITSALSPRTPSASTGSAGATPAGSSSKATVGAKGGAARSRVGCDAFDPADHKQLARLRLKATQTVTGCDWTLAAKAGTSAARVVRVSEDTGTSGLSFKFVQSAQDKTPVTTKGWNRDGWNTSVWVARGVRVGPGTAKATAKRYVNVVVGHEALGLTDKQGRALATAIAKAVSTRPVPKSH